MTAINYDPYCVVIVRLLVPILSERTFVPIGTRGMVLDVGDKKIKVRWDHVQVGPDMRSKVELSVNPKDIEYVETVARPKDS